jgi:hypothetical protein
MGWILAVAQHAAWLWLLLLLLLAFFSFSWTRQQASATVLHHRGDMPVRMHKPDDG